MLFEHVVDFLVEQRLFELSDKAANKLLNWMKNNKLPFDNLFPGGKLRVVVPLELDEIASSILRKIEQAGLKIDFDKGTVSDGRRETRIGKFILSKKSLFTKEEKDWFVKQGKAVEALKDVSRLLGDYAVVISRSPLDVVRMSDHEGRWSSCHSEGREYFRCAVSEAKYGGPIAYLVNKKDLRGVDLQQPEIFMDSDRGVSGIVPLARVRLRRFTNVKKGYDLAVPETKIYGRNVPGFVETVRRWVLKAQGGVTGGERPNMKEFVRRGGNYKDPWIRDSDWFNAMFGDDDSFGNVKYASDDEYEDWEEDTKDEVYRMDLLRDSCFIIQHDYLDALEFAEVTWDVVDGSRIAYSVSVSAEVAGELNRSLPKPNSAEWRAAVGDIERLCVEIGMPIDTHVDIEVLRNTRFSNEGMFVRGQSDVVDGNIVSFEEFARSVANVIEPSVKEFEFGCRKIFISRGFMVGRHPVFRALGYGGTDEAWKKNRFRHFEWEDIDEDHSLEFTKSIDVRLFDRRSGKNGYKIGKWPEFDIPEYARSEDWYEIPWYHPGFSEFVSAFFDRVIKLASSGIGSLEVVRSKQGDLSKDSGGDKGGKFTLRVSPSVKLYIDTTSKDVYLYMLFTINVMDAESVVRDAIKFIDYLDGNLNRVLKEAGELFERIVVAAKSR